ncbi:MAG: hypothetical protein J6B29_01930 [Clostridia bacterium]|nr:hypothetical protein [Clostridia bacterium]
MSTRSITIKEAFEVMSLVLILSIISVIMVYSSFERGMENMWLGNDSLVSAVQGMLQENEASSDQTEYKDIIKSKYEENPEEVDVFYELFEYYSEAKNESD